MENNGKKEKISLVKYLDAFIKINNKKWTPVKKNKGKVLIDGFQDVPTYIATASVISRAINSTLKFEPLPIISAKYIAQSAERKMFMSFGINQFINLQDYKYNIFTLFRSIASCFVFYLQVSSKQKLLEYRINGIKIGDLIYDSYIRYEHRYRNFSVYSFSFFKTLISSIYLFNTYKIFFKTYDIKYIILSHRVYVNCGLLARLGFFYDKKVIISRKTSVRIYQNQNIDSIYYHEFKPTDIIVNEIIENKLYIETGEYLDNRFSGLIKQHDVLNAYKNKKLYSRENLINQFNLNPNLPIVFIMPHVFSDAPHGNRELLFLDYYEWFIETIKAVNNIKTVNWFVKPHPSSYMYGEEGEVASIIKNLKLSNLHLVPDDISTLSVVQIASTIVTVNGSIGLEMACMGVKPIISGDSMYSGYNIAYEPKDKNEYFKLLNNIKTKQNLSPELVKTARSILYWTIMGSFSESKILDLPTVFTSRNPEELVKQKIQQYKRLNKNIKEYDYIDDPFYVKVQNMIANDEYVIKSYS